MTDTTWYNHSNLIQGFPWCLYFNRLLSFFQSCYCFRKYYGSFDKHSLSLLTAASFILLYISEFKYGVFIHSESCWIWMGLNSSFCSPFCSSLLLIYYLQMASRTITGILNFSPWFKAIRLLQLRIINTFLFRRSFISLIG